MPTNCAGLILQEFVDQNRKCLFHAELKPNGSTEIELLWENSTGRSYSFFENEVMKEYEEIKGEGYPDERKKASNEIFKICNLMNEKLYKNFGNIIWSIEGFWSPDDSKMIILQLRPTPQDRPKHSNRDIQNYVYKTNFVWGDFESDPFILDNNDKNNVYIRKEKYLEYMEDQILQKLSKGQNCLLIDPYRGFKISHEKWFLPPFELRNYFGFMYIPEEIIDKYQGKKVKILSSNGKGYLSLLE